MLVTKKRALPFEVVGGDLYYRLANTTTSGSFPIMGLQHTRGYDYGKGWGPLKYQLITLKRSRRDLGHSFYTRKDYYESESCRDFNGKIIGTIGSNPYYTFRGRLVASNPSFAASSAAAVESSNVELDAFGTSAIAKVRPTKPAYDAAVNLAELVREGLPKMVGVSLLKTKFKDPRKYGDEWLNLQFGIRPLVAGVEDAIKTAAKADRLMQQILRDNGRTVRRRYVAEPVTTRTIQTIPNQLPYGGGNANVYVVGSPSTLTREIVTTKQRWFSGAFTYYLPMGEDAISTFARSSEMAKRIYGIRVSPEVLWNLTPWSWALDWVTNAGDVIANVSAFSSEGLVMRYGYVMETTTTRITDTLHPTLGKFGKYTLQHSYGTTVKVRRRATPYGFGLDPGTFSAYQWGIIAALGISKAPKTLLP